MKVASAQSEHLVHVYFEAQLTAYIHSRKVFLVELVYWEGELITKVTNRNLVYTSRVDGIDSYSYM